MFLKKQKNRLDLDRQPARIDAKDSTIGGEMKRKKSPRLKKQDEYAKDFRPYMENPHAFRKNWPKKKARANRRLRAALRTRLVSGDESQTTRGDIKSTARKQQKIVKSYVVTLRQRIKNNLARRQREQKPSASN